MAAQASSIWFVPVSGLFMLGLLGFVVWIKETLERREMRKLIEAEREAEFVRSVSVYDSPLYKALE